VRKSKFTEEQIISILGEQENGMTVANISRKHGISGATFFKWKAKFGRKNARNFDRLQSLEEENAKLRNLLVEAMLEISTLKGSVQKRTSGG
jgi:putative transposase